MVGLGFHGIHALGFLLPRLGDVGGLGEVYLGKGNEMAGEIFAAGLGRFADGRGRPFAVLVGVVQDVFRLLGVLQVYFNARARAVKKVDLFVDLDGRALQLGKLGKGLLCGAQGWFVAQYPLRRFRLRLCLFQHNGRGGGGSLTKGGAAAWGVDNGGVQQRQHKRDDEGEQPS